MQIRWIPSYMVVEVKNQVQVVWEFSFIGITCIEVNDEDVATVDRIYNRITGKRKLKLKRNFKRK